jgi:uncharacterized protein (UPF0333 family)
MKEVESKKFLKKKAQMKISFGMIFSIILIIAFLAFAFWGIKKFVGVQETAMIAQFKSDLQNDVNTMWNGPQGQQLMKYKLPKKIENVCFRNSYENIYFEPRKYGSSNIEHVNIENNICFENKEGTVTIGLKKDFGENLVTVAK